MRMPSQIFRHPTAKITRDSNNAPSQVTLDFCVRCHRAVGTANADCSHDEHIEVKVWDADPDNSLIGKRFQSPDWEGRILNRCSPLSFVAQIGPYDPARTLMFSSWLSHQEIRILSISEMATFSFVAD